MIVKLGNWANHSAVGSLCESLMTIPGTSKKATPQRCMVRLSGQTIASIGLESGIPVVEFLPSKTDYADAHGARFVRPHPLPQMARDGWLQARSGEPQELQRVDGWIKSSIKDRWAATDQTVKK